MERQNYKNRIIDQQVEEYLKAFGAVCIEGPKWCGKTWTSSYHSKSAIYIGDPAGSFQNRQLAELSPALVLEGETPRLIDEWQEVPTLWDAVRFKLTRLHRRGNLFLPVQPRRIIKGSCIVAQDVSHVCVCGQCLCGNLGFNRRSVIGKTVSRRTETGHER